MSLSAFLLCTREFNAHNEITASKLEIDCDYENLVYLFTAPGLTEESGEGESLNSFSTFPLCNSPLFPFSSFATPEAASDGLLHVADSFRSRFQVENP